MRKVNRGTTTPFIYEWKWQ